MRRAIKRLVKTRFNRFPPAQWLYNLYDYILMNYSGDCIKENYLARELLLVLQPRAVSFKRLLAAAEGRREAGNGADPIRNPR